MKNIEQWVLVKGYEKEYAISSFGVVKSLARTMPHPKGKGVINKKEKLIKVHFRFGYYKVTLCKDGKEKNYPLHRLLAICFKENPNNYPIVRHLNDIKTDNRLENLEWGTHYDNIQDAIKNGKILKGEKHPLFGRVIRDQKGNKNNMYGKSKDKHHFWGGKHPNAKIILDTQTGIFYACLREACEAKNINKSTLDAMMKGRIKNKTSFIYA